VKVAAILNPKAGLAAQRAMDVLRRGRPTWPSIAIQVTTGPGAARGMAEALVAEGTDIVLAVGGDGTVNEVAQGLLGSKAVLGIVPMGSGNGLARGLRIPLDPAQALATLEASSPRLIDVGIADGRPFFNVAGFGFDALVGAAFQARGTSGRRGIWKYVEISLAQMLSYRPSRVTIEAAGKTLDLTPFIVVLANGQQYGAGAWIAPDARLDDGLLDVIVIRDAPVWRLLLAVPSLFRGRLTMSPLYERLRASRVVVQARDAFPHHRDGEPEMGSERLEIDIWPKALSILVPNDTGADPHGPFGASG
jgi:diacylglycerol kinase (ATP)